MTNFKIDRLNADIDLLNELVEKKDTLITDLKAWQVISDDEIAALQGVINKRDERIAELVKHTAKVELAFAILENREVENVQRIAELEEVSKTLQQLLIEDDEYNLLEDDKRYTTAINTLEGGDLVEKDQ